MDTTSTRIPSAHGWVLPAPSGVFLLQPSGQLHIFPFRKGNFHEDFLSYPLLPLRRELHFIPPSNALLAHTAQVTALGWHQTQVSLCERRGCHPSVPSQGLWYPRTHPVTITFLSLCVPLLLSLSSALSAPMRSRAVLGTLRLLLAPKCCMGRHPQAATFLLPWHPGRNAYLQAQLCWTINTFPSPQTATGTASSHQDEMGEPKQQDRSASRAGQMEKPRH